MWIEPKIISMITTYRCPASCEQCCFRCGPLEGPTITLDEGLRLIDESAEISSVKLMVFTGGECFLLGESLVKLVEYSTKRGLLTRCVTNGYWATSSKSAKTRINQLKAAGLNEINFSTGSFHSNHVPIKNVIQGAIVCAESEINTVINIELFQESKFDCDIIAENKSIKKLVEQRKIQINRNRWMPNGKELLENIQEGPENSRYSTPISHEESASRFYGEQNKSACASSLNILAITPDLKLISCCGLTLRYMPDLVLGDLRTQTISQALKDTKPDILKMWLFLEGPEKVLDFVRSHDVDFSLPSEAVHPCHSCLSLYSNDRARRVLREHYEEVEERICTNYFMTLAGLRVAQDVGKIYLGNIHLTPPQLERLQML